MVTTTPISIPKRKKPLMVSLFWLTLALVVVKSTSALLTPTSFGKTTTISRDVPIKVHTRNPNVIPTKTTTSLQDTSSAAAAAQIPRGGGGGGGGGEIESGTGTATIPNEVFNLVKSIVGAGVLSLPAGTLTTITGLNLG